MGHALLAGWLEHELDPRQIIVQDPAPPPRANELLRQHGIDTRATITSLPAPPSVLVLAVKPQIMDQVLTPLARLAGPQTVVLSIAAGRTIASLAQHLRQGCGHRAVHAQYPGLHRPGHHCRGRQQERHRGPAPNLR